MSSFLFVKSPNIFKKMSNEEILSAISKWKEVVDKVDWSKYESCDAIYDQASGYQANILMAEKELGNRSKGIDSLVERVLVPGFNPKY